MEIGGGFGGKISVYIKPGRCVAGEENGLNRFKVLMNRADVFEGTRTDTCLLRPRQDGCDQRG